MNQNALITPGRDFGAGKSAVPTPRSIGIELVNFSLGQNAYAPAQIEKLIFFLKKLINKYQISPEMIVGHSDITPLRKADPGKAFPWKQLAKAGIGLWYQPRNAEKMHTSDIKIFLATIGYDTRTPEAVNASAYAFCRRFAPQFVHTDTDILHLVDHILPDNFDFMNTQNSSKYSKPQRILTRLPLNKSKYFRLHFSGKYTIILL